MVTRDVPAFALMVGSPAKRIGWMCKCGERLEDKPFQKCIVCGADYKLSSDKCIMES